MVDKLPRYEVETEFRPGVRTNVYRGDSRGRAVAVLDHWDYYQDTYLIDYVNMSPLELANIKFDRAISALGGPFEDPNPWFCTLCGRLSNPFHTGPLHSIGLFHAGSTVKHLPRTLKAYRLNEEERHEGVLAAEQRLSAWKGSAR